MSTDARHDASVLDLFLPPVREWFRRTLGEPTPPQVRGWPAIARGENTLILAPTGSGKTLAAFLVCLDHLWRQPQLPAGVQVLYVSPLKALNNDIQRNLQLPLTGVAATARELGQPLPELTCAVRTGDTPPAERQRQLRHPPHILITTPESLHLLLTSRGREMLRRVTHVIVDEIHALSPNKRGVFLALLLERLEQLRMADGGWRIPQNQSAIIRIGLSATQRPVEEAARYLGGCEMVAGELRPRPVTIIDAGQRKDLDLQVVAPVEQFGPLPEKSIWPSIQRLLADLIRQHRGTIVFTNNRRSVERLTAGLNAEPAPAPDSEPNAPDDSAPPLARAHHGSVSLEARHAIETALKEGRLPAVVATASLELGIDMGAVELVCQVESPGSVARGLQRVGRAGHLVGQKSKGRLIPKTLADLLEQAVLARETALGNVEEIHVPQGCLDVLAQQIVAMVAVEPWEVPALYALVRRAWPYRHLTPPALESVLEMVSGRFRFPIADRGEGVSGGSPATASSGGQGGDLSNPQPQLLSVLRPRISWDRVHNRLHALPGSRQLALVHGGTIPDTGQYAVVTTTGVRLGELDEEFVYERRLGDTFLLGTTAWRVEEIDTDRVVVSPAEGHPALVPFWRGEQTGRSPDLGLALGRFLRELAERLHEEGCLSWLRENYFLDQAAARNLAFHVRRQLERTGCLPTDQTLFIEASRDELGDWQVVLLSPLGSRLHLALRLALESRLRQRLGYSPQCLHHNDGVLIRLTDSEEPVLDLFDGLDPDRIEQRILDELADSALFALRFRHNAARALLLPRAAPGKRAPLWLQRLRGKDLLQVARRHPDFPIVIETFRECLHDHLDVPRLQQLLGEIQGGRVKVVTKRLDSPSPFASGLLFAFHAAYQYHYDETETAPQQAALDRHLLDQLVKPERQGHLLDPRAVQLVERRLRGLGQPPRSASEMAEWLRRLGDLTPAELEGPMAGFLAELERDGRAKVITLVGTSSPVLSRQKGEIPGMAARPAEGGPASLDGEERRVANPTRWILTEEEPLYRRAFGLELCEPTEQQRAAETILARFLATHALVGLDDILGRYPLDPAWARTRLEEWARTGRAVVVPSSQGGGAEPLQYSAPENLERVQRGSLGLLRREVLTVPAPQFVDFVLRWQGLHPDCHKGGIEGLGEVLHRLQGLLLPAELWEQWLLPARVPGYQPRWLDETLASGAVTWVCQQNGDSGPELLAFLQRDGLAEMSPPAVGASLDHAAELVLECLRNRGALFVTDLSLHTHLSPATVRNALWTLVRAGIVTNDRFDPIRTGEEVAVSAAMTNRKQPALMRRGLLQRPLRPEGRWSLLPWQQPNVETQAVHAASVLLQRYGIAARELAQMDPWLPPWRVLYEVLSRLELAGEVRRGYFVEGFSGAQFALPEAAQLLQELSLPATVAAPVVLLHSMDPANLYGGTAPLALRLLAGGTASLQRRPGNWLVLKAGRPLLLIEQQGKRLTTLPGASEAELAAAVATLPRLLRHDRGLAARHKLSVSEWNGKPVTASAGAKLLEQAGFVRDYQDLTLYAAWQ